MWFLRCDQTDRHRDTFATLPGSTYRW